MWSRPTNLSVLAIDAYTYFDFGTIGKSFYIAVEICMFAPILVPILRQSTVRGLSPLWNMVDKSGFSVVSTECLHIVHTVTLISACVPQIF